MGSLFRSEAMSLAQLFLQSEAVYACVRELGELGKVQFRDLNPDVSAFQRKFVNEVRRCDEMERKLRFFAKEVEKAGLTPRSVSFDIRAPDPPAMIDLENEFQQLEAQVKDIESHREQIQKNLIDLVELKHVLLNAQVDFEHAERETSIQQRQNQDEIEQDLIVPGEGDEEGVGGRPGRVNLEFVTGTIARDRFSGFERVMWRATRGNVYVRHSGIPEPIRDPATGNEVYKDVFVLFFTGENLKNRVKKICEGYRATLYPCPENRQERREMLTSIDGRIMDLNQVLHETYIHSQDQLGRIANELETWNVQVKKIKAIYHTMNMFNLDVTAKCLIAEGWCPVDDMDVIQDALNRGTEYSGASVQSILRPTETKQKPPTYNKTNKFTTGFQSIVDAYGIGNYQEVNPTPYTIITFPFLFAVMFGDAGHGLIMALFAFSMILFEKKLARWRGGGEIFETMYHGRYIIFLMGLFSIYTGFIYNDVFSKSMNIFGTSWNVTYDDSTWNDSQKTAAGLDTNNHHVVRVSSDLYSVPVEAFKRNSPYPIGIDPIWQLANNKLLTLNSFKMKLSVVLGVIHMLFGIILSLFNHIHFKQYYRILFQFIPEVLFLMSIFGWLVFLIFFKWITFYEDKREAPQLLIALINMFLKFGSLPEQNVTLVFSPAEAQQYVQILLVLTAVVCVPWLLLPSPIYLLVRQKIQSRRKADYQPIEDGEERENGDIAGGDAAAAQEDGEHLEAGEIFVHQAIHTIEFCLGCISNTASYLRLWALSLAHAQLSEVLWEQIFKRALKLNALYISIPAIFIAFSMWAAGTIAVLLVMEGLSAFLHALRLHWVEFQNKFYVGEGYRFVPFSFYAILTGEAEE